MGREAQALAGRFEDSGGISKAVTQALPAVAQVWL